MAVIQQPSDLDILLVEADFPSTEPATLFAYWTEPALLQQWWPPEAEIQPEVGGTYHLSWPGRNWHLRGHYTHFEPTKRLGFTWRWDHDPQEMRTREVTLVLEPLTSGGTRLHLTHKPYDLTPEEQEVRIEQHLTGWTHFLACLQQAVEAPAQ
ncbi:MAG TPA: SRPBCC domain-containing protein [Ktedonobacteraceae bacterium]|nr:SRPBCC domain-containing protein [Ktedonobacteraceae bacterium]